MEAGVLAKWHVKEGDFVDADQLLMEVATDKATVEYNAIDPGYIRKVLIKEGQEAKVNQPLAILTEEAGESIEGYTPEGVVSGAPAEAPKAIAVEVEKPHVDGKRPFASPLARSIARSKGIDLSTIKGSGPSGRIMSRDLTETVSLAPNEEPLSQVRKIIAKRLQEAKMSIPHFYVSIKADVGRLLELREELKGLDVKLTINDFVIRATALALGDHPEINKGFNDKNQSIIRFDRVDISIAVDVEGGLITPIITDALNRPIADISEEVKVLADKAKRGKLQLHEFQGGSFTISNLGMFGVHDFAAIINPPQGAILAVGGIEKGLKLEDAAVVESSHLCLTLSVDHRVIDGAMAARFLQTLKNYLEAPALLLM